MKAGRLANAVDVDERLTRAIGIGPVLLTLRDSVCVCHQRAWLQPAHLQAMHKVQPRLVPTPVAKAEANEDENVFRHPDLWFSDGSVVLKAESAIFRVHISQLARSLFFLDTFSLPQPTFQTPGWRLGQGPGQGTRRHFCHLWPVIKMSDRVCVSPAACRKDMGELVELAYAYRS